MTHKYPFGAIENEEAIVFGLLGQTLYSVHALGPDSFLTVMANVRNLHGSDSGYRVIEYTDITRGSAWDTDICLGDRNIGAHHNQHYMFHTREDAEAYLIWATENTPGIQPSPFEDWGYDYDDFSDD